LALVHFFNGDLGATYLISTPGPDAPSTRIRTKKERGEKLERSQQARLTALTLCFWVRQEEGKVIAILLLPHRIDRFCSSAKFPIRLGPLSTIDFGMD